MAFCRRVFLLSLCCAFLAHSDFAVGAAPLVAQPAGDAAHLCFSQGALAEPLISRHEGLPSIGSLYAGGGFWKTDLRAARPSHLSPLDPARDILEWFTVQLRYTRFLRRYHLNPALGRMVIHPSGKPTLRMLMCYPRHFTVPWSINFHMRPQAERVDRVHAAEQWEYLVRSLLTHGAEIELIDQEPSLADMVFTANGGVVHGNVFVPPHFANPERQGETPLFENYFRERGYTIADVAANSLWEGEGDTLVHDDREKGITRFGGFGAPEKGFRSNILGQQAVAMHLGQHFVGLELVDPRFYHLDTCFFPLGDGKSALYYPGAFSPEALRRIQRWVTNPIPISEEDAIHFACNGVTIGRTVILNRASIALQTRLKQEGYSVLETPTTEFLKSGGSVKCLILLLSGPLRFYGSTERTPMDLKTVQAERPTTQVPLNPGLLRLLTSA